MDKLAPAIAWTKKNWFWLTNGLLLLLMIGIWFMQTGNLKEQQSSNESKIKTQFNTADGIMRKTPEDIADAGVKLHPNRTTQEGMQAELERTVDSIVAAWQLRVETQKKLLVFPELGSPKFNQIFGRYNPPETFPVEYTDGEIEGLLGLYNSKIQEHMIKLCGKGGVRTNWRKDPDNYEQTDEPGARRSRDSYGDDYGDGGAFEVEDEDAARFAVLWSEVNQNLWFDKLTVFQDRDDHSKSSIDPTPLQCYMLQQDLWVLEAMFNVIRELNGDSTAIDTSAIKQIDHIGIGREGNVQLGELHPVDSRLAPKGGGDSEEEDFDDEYGGYDDGGYDSGGTGSGASQYEDHFSEEDPVATDEYGDSYEDEEYGDTTVAVGLPPFHEMYVDTNFEPIASAEVLKVVKGEELPESNLELIIAKRLPVRIALKMDERKISDFMAASINSPFSFEIQQVRINRHTPGGEEIDLGGGGGLNQGSDNGYGGGGRDDDRGSSFDDVSRAETRTNYDVNVEFFGIIKIYNPVRADLIRKAANIEEDEEESLDSAANRGGSAGRAAG